MPNYFRKAAAEGRAVELVVARAGKDGAKPEQTKISITPHVPTTFNQLVPEGVPMGVPGAGFAYEIGNTVVSVSERGPGEAAGVAPAT